MDLTMPARCPKGHVSTDPDYCSECGAKMPAAPSGLDIAGVSPASSRFSAQSVLAAAQSGSSHVCPDCGTPRATPTATFCEVCRYNYVTQTSWATPKVTNQPAPPSVAIPASDSSTSVLPATSNPSADSLPPAVTPAAIMYVVPSSAATLSTSAPADPVPADASAASLATGDYVPAPDASADSLPSTTSNPDGLTLAPIARWEARLTIDPSLNVDPDPALPCPIGEPERVFPLDFPDNLIGRRSEKRAIFPEISVNDPCSSHRHAKIQRLADGSFALLDVGSTNGTQLNGAEVQPNVLTPLKDGDQITLGCWTRITIRGLRS